MKEESAQDIAVKAIIWEDSQLEPAKGRVTILEDSKEK